MERPTRQRRVRRHGSRQPRLDGRSQSRCSASCISGCSRDQSRRCLSRGRRSAKCEAATLDDALVYRKNLRKSADDYTATTPPHVVAARKSTQPPERLIRYVMTTAGPSRSTMSGTRWIASTTCDKQMKPVAEPVLSDSRARFRAGDRRQPPIRHVLAMGCALTLTVADANMASFVGGDGWYSLEFHRSSKEGRLRLNIRKWQSRIKNSWRCSGRRAQRERGRVRSSAPEENPALEAIWDVVCAIPRARSPLMERLRVPRDCRAARAKRDSRSEWRPKSSICPGIGSSVRAGASCFRSQLASTRNRPGACAPKACRCATAGWPLRP
jgi:hypothetical protein